MTEPTCPSCYICTNCGTQYEQSASPPPFCPICVDDRQYVAAGGQRWTTHDRLLQDHRAIVRRDHQLLGVGVDFGIAQRALVVPTAAGTILWDCTSLVTDDAVERLTQDAPITAIAISHPHFYSSMVEWSDALGGVPILIHAADEAWIARRSPHLELWSGDRLRLAEDAELIHLPGHFPGSSGLHSRSSGRRSFLASGDSLHVAADRRHVSVMHSVPNYVPVGPATITDLQRRLAGLEFDDLYGFTWGHTIVGNADAAVRDSLDRYLAAIQPAACQTAVMEPAAG